MSLNESLVQFSDLSNQQLNARLAIIGDSIRDTRAELDKLVSMETAIRMEMDKRSGKVTSGEMI